MTDRRDDPAALLHPAVVHHIVNSLGWSRLRPLQELAIAPILAGHHALLVAPTAGGKTEAAIFPILSQMLTADTRGLTVLYLCPLRALLNNLHIRLDGYAQLLGRRVGLWHGDVGDSARQRLLADPPDILLTTPESLEAMLVSTRVAHDRWFADLRTVVIDEAHAFGSDDRGWHMMAVLERVSRLAGRELQRVALSATVGNPAELLAWITATCSRPAEVVIPPPEAGPVPEITLDFVGSLENAALVISRLHRGQKRLVFVDSRSKAEKLTALLRAHEVPTFISHGSLGRDERARAEEAFASERDAVIVATSTLELGIDVGDLDRVIQIDAPNSVASFLQRLGRTGRREGSSRNTLFLATSDEALLRAAGLLVQWSRGEVEPVVAPPLPAHLLAQQALALTLQQGRIGRQTWMEWLGQPCALGAEVGSLAEQVTDHLVASGYLVDDGGMLTVGLRAESEFGRRHFLELLAAFTAPPLFSVLHGRREIGQVPDKALMFDGPPHPLLLAGRSWWITSIDWRRRQVQVEPHDKRGVARWDGATPYLPAASAQAIRAQLAGTELNGAQLSRRAVEKLAEIRAAMPWVRINSTTLVRDEAGRVRWWTFAGDLANQWLADAAGATSVDSLFVSFDTADTEQGIRARIGAIDADHLELPATVAVSAREGLKFADLLPEALASTVLHRRLDARVNARATLREPINLHLH